MISSWFLSLCVSQLLPRWCSGKNPPANAGDVGDSPWPKVQSLGSILGSGSFLGSGRSPGGQHGYPFQYSCLENSVDRGVWWATVQRVTKNQIQLSDWALIDWLISQLMGTKKTTTSMGRGESLRYFVVEHESFSLTRWESVAPVSCQTWIPVMSTWWLGSKIASFLPSCQVAVNLMLFTLVWIICVNYESLLSALCITSWPLSPRMQSASVSTWSFLKLSVHSAQSGCLDFCPSHKIGQLAWVNEWMNVQPPPAQFFFIFIYLHWVLIVTLGIFDLPGGMSDFYLCYARSFLNCGLWGLVPWPGIEPRPPCLGNMES